jgi:hypothetical protein
MNFVTKPIIGFILIASIIITVQAMTPPQWIGQGTQITYSAALTPYYELVNVHDDTWINNQNAVYGYWVDEVTGSDGYGGYQGYSTIYSAMNGNILVQTPWSYNQGNEGMGLFWLDKDMNQFTSQFLVADAPLELAGKVWNAQTYYFHSIGNTYDTKITIDKDSGLLLTKNEGLTGAGGQMQRAIYILQSVK